MAIRSSRKRKETETEETNISINNADQSSANLHSQIAARAYEIYLSRNGAPGDDLSDWMAAEREVLAILSNPVPFADNVIPINSTPAQRKRRASAKTSTARSSTPKSASTTTRKRKEKGE